MMVPAPAVSVGDVVELTGFDPDHCIIPDGLHTVSRICDDGWFHVGGNWAVNPSRIARVVTHATPPSPSTLNKDYTS